MDKPMLRLNPLEPSLSTVVMSMARHWVLVCASLIGGMFLALVAYLVISPSYESTASLLVGAGQDGSADKGYRVETIATLARVAESDEVVRAAIERVGVKELQLGAPEEHGRSLGGQIRELFSSSAHQGEMEPISAVDVAVTQVGRLITVRTDPNSEVIRISVRHRDPNVSATFANALARSFIERQINLLERPGAIEFFKHQVSQFNSEVARTTRALEDFMSREKTYSIDEQLALLLKRRSELEAVQGGTRSSLAQKQGQRQSLVNQLRLLKPVTQSPYVSQLVEALGGGATVPARRPKPDENGEVPPLLMVKVYQDNMVDLFRYNSEITGLEHLLKAQQAEIDKIQADLNNLTQRQVEFDRLKRDVSLATHNLDLFSKRAVEEKINSDLRNAKISNLRILQNAAVPLRAVSPKGILFAAAGLILGIVLAVSLSLSIDLFGPAPPYTTGSSLFARKHVADIGAARSKPERQNLATEERGEDDYAAKLAAAIGSRDLVHLGTRERR